MKNTTLFILLLALSLLLFSACEEGDRFTSHELTFESTELEMDTLYYPVAGTDMWRVEDFLLETYHRNNNWYGFAVSSYHEVHLPDPIAKATAATTGGYDETHRYGLARFEKPLTISFGMTEGTVFPRHIFVTNTLWLAHIMRYGTDDFTPFGGISGDEPEWVRIVFTGLDVYGVPVGQVERHLADFRNGKEYINTNWAYVDLTPLGEIMTLEVMVYTSRGDEMMPFTCAFDNLRVRVYDEG